MRVFNVYFQGYEGVLCGSCAVGYGKKQAECRKCAEPRVTRFYIVCVALWSLVLLGVTIRNAVISFQEMEQVKSFWKQERNLQIIGEHAGGPNQATPPGFQYQQPQGTKLEKLCLFFISMPHVYHGHILSTSPVDLIPVVLVNYHHPCWGPYSCTRQPPFCLNIGRLISCRIAFYHLIVMNKSSSHLCMG